MNWKWKSILARLLIRIANWLHRIAGRLVPITQRHDEDDTADAMRYSLKAHIRKNAMKGLCCGGTHADRKCRDTGWTVSRALLPEECKQCDRGILIGERCYYGSQRVGRGVLCSKCGDEGRDIEREAMYG